MILMAKKQKKKRILFGFDFGRAFSPNFNGKKKKVMKFKRAPNRRKKL